MQRFRRRLGPLPVPQATGRLVAAVVSSYRVLTQEVPAWHPGAGAPDAESMLDTVDRWAVAGYAASDDATIRVPGDLARITAEQAQAIVASLDLALGSGLISPGPRPEALRRNAITLAEALLRDVAADRATGRPPAPRATAVGAAGHVRAGQAGTGTAGEVRPRVLGLPEAVATRIDYRDRRWCRGHGIDADTDLVPEVTIDCPTDAAVLAWAGLVSADAVTAAFRRSPGDRDEPRPYAVLRERGRIGTPRSLAVLFGGEGEAVLESALRAAGQLIVADVADEGLGPWLVAEVDATGSGE